MLVVRASIRPKFDSSRDPRLLSRHALRSNRNGRSSLHPGKNEAESRALSGRTLEFNVPAHQLSQLFQDGKAQAGAAQVRALALALGERLEDARMFLGWNAVAGITDLEREDVFRGRTQARREGGAQTNRSVLGEFDGIADAVIEDLAQAQFVEHNQRRQGRIDLTG